MADEKKPTEETQPEPKEQDEQKSSEEKPAEPPKEEPKAEEKSTDEPQEEKKGEGEKVPAPPELSEEDKLKEENFRLKTQLEAMKIGFSSEVIEDAVVLAENIVKKDGSDISAALQVVAKKYPDWKAADRKNGKSKGGFKVGADTSGSKSTSDEKLNRAFGIKK